MLLRPDFTFYLKGIRVRRYDLTQHNPNAIPMPTAVMDRDSIVGITIHNTNRKPPLYSMGTAEQCVWKTMHQELKRCAGTLLCGRIRGVANAAVTARRLARYRWGRERKSPYHCHWMCDVAEQYHRRPAFWEQLCQACRLPVDLDEPAKGSLVHPYLLAELQRWRDWQSGRIEYPSASL